MRTSVAPLRAATHSPRLAGALRPHTATRPPGPGHPNRISWPAASSMRRTREGRITPPVKAWSDIPIDCAMGQSGIALWTWDAVPSEPVSALMRFCQLTKGASVT